MAKDMYSLYKTFINHNQVKHYESFKTLATIFDQQCEIAEGADGEKMEIVIREKPKGDEIISTPHNTSARYVKKGKQKVCGHKGFASESCEETNKTQFQRSGSLHLQSAYFFSDVEQKFQTDTVILR